MLHRDSHFKTNFRVWERRGDRSWEVAASLKGTDQLRVSFGPFADVLIYQSQIVIRNGAKKFEHRLPFPRTINEYSQC